METKARPTAGERREAGAGGGQVWPSDIGLAFLLVDHFAKGRRLAGLAGIAGTVGVQAAAAFGVLDVDDPRLFGFLAVYGVVWSLVVWLVPWEVYGERWIACISLASTVLIFATVWLSAGGQSPAWIFHVFVVFLNALYLRRRFAYRLLPFTIALSVLPALLDGDRTAAEQQLLVVAPVYLVITVVGTTLVGQLIAALYARLRELETRRLYEEARLQADTDGLTELLNHRAVQRRLGEDLAAAGDGDRAVSVLMLDLDNFKQVNDTHGHQAGDEVLRGIAAALRAVCGETDAIARYGGDEFMIILPDTPATLATTIASRVANAAANAITEPLPGVWVVPQVSVGVATFPDDGTTAAALTAVADRRLYAAKHADQRERSLYELGRGSGLRAG